MNPIATAGAFLMLCPLLALCQEPHRLALVIGNSRYVSLPQATSASAEARLMKTALTAVGFTVTLKENVNNDDFFNIEADFLQTVQPGDVCVFYYSGHASQIVNDDDYLLPIDFPPDSDKDMEQRAFRLTRLIEDLGQKRASLKILIVEAPHRIATAIRGANGSGLGMPNIRTSTGRGTLVALAAGTGHYISPTPKPGDIGLFTRALVDRVPRPGLKLSDFFFEAKQEVEKKTNQEQVPDWNYSVLPEGFHFTAPLPVKVPDPTPPPPPATVVVNVSTTVPTSKIDRLEYVYIPAGSFNMGCVSSDKRCDGNEKPSHRVTLSKGFWMGRTEVEVAAYQRYIAASNKKVKMPGAAAIYNKAWTRTNYPMMMVTWDEANSYCGWAGGRLPTEAEWEYAARGGKEDQIFPWTGDNIRDKANFDGTSGSDIYPQLAPVRSFEENPFHLFDMAGNVWEWVSDFYSPDYYKVSPKLDPAGPDKGKEHVKRGGSFESDWQVNLRISVRQPQGNTFLYRVGFRCVLDETDRTKQTLNLP